MVPFNDNPLADADGDGFGALVEHYLGTSDTLAGDAINRFTLPDDRTFTVQISPHAGGVHATVELSLDLTSWSAGNIEYLGENRTADGMFRSYRHTDPVDTLSRFFRVVVASSN